MIAMETKTGGEIITFFGYGRNNKKLASIKKSKWIPWVEKTMNLLNYS